MMRRFGGIALALLLLAASAATAQAAPEQREIDTRVLADGTENGDYGADGTLDEGGLDVLALDVYEGTLPGSTAPALVFRVIVEGGDPSSSHVITLDFDAGGAQSYDLKTSDLETYTSTTFPVVRGPFDIGDPKAIEGVVPFSALGVATGDDVSGIVVTSHVDDGQADRMPGSWYFAGQEVPLLPTEGAGEPGQYALRGTPEWFSLNSSAGLIAPALEPTNITLTLSSALTDLEQSVTLGVDAPAGVNATLSSQTTRLGPGASNDVTLMVAGVGVGDIKITAESDLGLTQVISFPLAGNATVGNGAGVTGPLLAQGGSFQYRFTDPATFEFHCHPHPWMQGTVEIVEDDPTNEPQSHIIRMVEHDHSDPDTFAFSPETITVEVNDTVIWINAGSQQHNVHGESGLGSGDGHDHDHDHETSEGSKDTPGMPVLVLAVMLAVLVARRR